MSDPVPAPGVLALAELSAGLTDADGEALASLLRRAAEEAGPRAVEEAILQAHLFLGFPSALRGLRAWRRIREGTTGSGPSPDAPRPAEPDLWEERGEEVCRRVYGSAYRGLRRNVRRLHPEMDAWMIRDGYGKVLGREGLDLASREVCIVATLASAGAPRETLHSHLRGALRTGAGPELVEAALEAGLGRRPEADREAARELWRRVRDRSGTGSDD